MINPYYETKLGKLYCANCLDIISEFKLIDLTITSPPYDNLRKYKGYDFNFEIIAKKLYHITKNGGVVVWVINDQTINGSETGTSFKQALYFKKIGFNLHDTMFYQKKSMPLTHNRYEQSVEYMFVFSKGKPKTFNPILKKCKHSGKKLTGTRRHDLNELKTIHGVGKQVLGTKIKENIWFYGTGNNQSSKDKEAFKHPAIFPEQLANDHIISWSNKNDLILDPMCGSGTVLKMAEQLKRKWIGIDSSEEYCEIAAKRIDKMQIQKERIPNKNIKQQKMYRFL